MSPLCKMATEENSPDLGLQAEAANRQRARSRSSRRAGTLSVEVHSCHVQQIVINVTPDGRDTDGGGHHTRFASAAMTQMEVAAGICSGLQQFAKNSPCSSQQRQRQIACFDTLAMTATISHVVSFPRCRRTPFSQRTMQQSQPGTFWQARRSALQDRHNSIGQ